MDKKIIQEQRMKRYFIDAAMKVVREDGIDNLTVKKVADLAGYASGTLYNYFTDLNNLLFHCTLDFLDECKGQILKNAEGHKGIKERIIALSRAYCEYFIENPNIFELVFLKDLGEAPEHLRERVYIPEVALVLQRALKEAVGEQMISEGKVTIIENLIGSSIHGMLLFFIKERSPLNKEEILELIEMETAFLLEG